MFKFRVSIQLPNSIGFYCVFLCPGGGRTYGIAGGRTRGWSRLAVLFLLPGWLLLLLLCY